MTLPRRFTGFSRFGLQRGLSSAASLIAPEEAYFAATMN
jgi:hypothetical protein